MNIVFCIAEPETDAMHIQQPVEVLYTGTILQGMGHNIRVLDFRIENPDIEQISQQPSDLIFLLTQTYDRTQCFSLKLDKAKAVSNLMRTAQPDVPIVAVGVHGSIEPELTQREQLADYTLPGELEAAVPWFVQKYIRGEELHKQLFSPDVVPQQIDPSTLPVPDYSLIKLSNYRGEVVDRTSGQIHFSKAGLIFANRGCPYACAYCFVWFGKKLRYRPVELVVEELRSQQLRGVKHFFFLDYTFTLDRRWVIDLCKVIKTIGLDISWMCQTRCERVDPEILGIMHDAGCTGIFYGIESPWIQHTNMLKPTARPIIDNAIQATSAAGIRCFAFILLGLENKDSAVASQLVDWLASTPVIFSARPVLPRPHTTLWQTHVEISMFNSWSDLFTTARSTAREYYWLPELKEVFTVLKELPNNILNIPITSAND